MAFLSPNGRRKTVGWDMFISAGVCLAYISPSIFQQSEDETAMERWGIEPTPLTDVTLPSIKDPEIPVLDEDGLNPAWAFQYHNSAKRYLDTKITYALPGYRTVVKSANFRTDTKIFTYEYMITAQRLPALFDAAAFKQSLCDDFRQNPAFTHNLTIDLAINASNGTAFFRHSVSHKSCTYYPPSEPGRT